MTEVLRLTLTQRLAHQEHLRHAIIAAIQRVHRMLDINVRPALTSLNARSARQLNGDVLHDFPHEVNSHLRLSSLKRSVITASKSKEFVSANEGFQLVSKTAPLGPFAILRGPPPIV